MEWIIAFSVSWILFILLVDLKELKYNIWCGLLALAEQIYVDESAITRGFYEIDRPVISFMGSSAFFGFGPVLVIGILMSQFQPSRRWARIIHVLLLASLYSMQEYLLWKAGALIYLNWSLIESVFINFSVLIVLSWFSIVVLKRGVIQ